MYQKYFNDFSLKYTYVFSLKMSIFAGIRTIAPSRGKLTPRLGLEFGSRLGLVLRLGDNQTIAPLENCPPVRVRGWVRVSFGVGDNFPGGQLS